MNRIPIRIVLVRPRNPLNIGAAARAMANFGLRDLAVVVPYEATWREARSALGAQGLLHAAHHAASLAEAIGDRTFVVGTTSGARRTLDREPIPLSELPPLLKKRARHARVALLFGPEKHGLTNEHLSFCHVLVRIPTAADCPSMNLGQAVAVCTYELARADILSVRALETKSYSSPRAPVEALENLLQRAVQVLEQVGYLKPRFRERRLLRLRRLLFDCELTNNGVRILGDCLAQLRKNLGKCRSC